MEPRMYRAEPSLVMNAERSEPKLPLCPSCARNMRLIRRTQRFGTLPDVCTFECRAAAFLISKNMSRETQRCVDLK